MLRDKIKEHDKKYGMGNFYKFIEGKTQLRILAEAEEYEDVMDEKPKGTFITYALIRDPLEGDHLAVINVPMLIIRWLGDEEDLGKFDSYPMPYDVVITRKGSGLNSKYSINSLPESAGTLTSLQTDAIKTLKPVRELANILEDKKRGTATSRPAGIGSPAMGMPQLESKEEAEYRSRRNKAEMNMTFAKFQNEISAALDEPTLTGIVENIKRAQEFNAIDDFEVELLTKIMAQKAAKIRGDTGTGNDDEINVEGIPF